MSHLFPLVTIPGGTASPMGFPMCQNRLAVPTWSYAMEMYPPARIIELGSYNGGFTIAIGLHAYRIGAQVVSYDRMVAPSEDFEDIAAFLGIEFRLADIFAKADEIVSLIQGPGVTYLLCDGGDKTLEFNTFSQHIKPGDVIAAHDYMVDPSCPTYWVCSEIRRDDVLSSVGSYDLEPFYQEHFDMAGWLAYRKRS